MMKNWKKIAALLAVLVVFVAAFIFLNSNQGKLATPSDTPSPTASSSVDEVKIFDIARDKIAKIILKREDSDILLTQEERSIEKLTQKEDGTTARVTENAKVWVTSTFDVDSSTVDNIALAADTATTKRLIEDNPKDATIYGLDKALVTTIVSIEGKEISLEIGDKTPMGDSYYIRKTGNTAVYTLDSYKGNTLRYGKFDIMSKNLYGTDALTINDITALTFSKGGEKIFEGKQNGKPTEWIITSPLQRKANYNDLSKFLQWMVGFRVSNFIEENPANLSTYGLDKPRYIFDFTLRGQNYILKLGSLKDASYYAQLEGNPVVFTLESSTLTFVDMGVLDMVEKFVYIPSIYDVEKLVIELDGRVDELIINANKDDSTKEEFFFNGKKIDEDDKSVFKRYYQGAIGISGDKVDLTANPSGKGIIRLTYTMRTAGTDGKIVVIDLIQTPAKEGYYLMKNNQYTGLVVSNRQLDDTDMGIRPSYTNLMEGISKTP